MHVSYIASDMRREQLLSIAKCYSFIHMLLSRVVSLNSSLSERRMLNKRLAYDVFVHKVSNFVVYGTV